MKYRILGKSGLRVSVIGLGTWQFGGEWGRDFTPAEVKTVVDAACDAGINFIDTAECYGDHLSESLVGAAVKGKRDRLVIATKFGHRYDGLFKREDLWTPSDVQRQLEDSLRALGTDYIDLYQFHSGGDTAFDQTELWEMLKSQVQAGKIRHLGISISSKGARQHQIDSAARVGASAVQVVYNRLECGPESEILPSCARQNVGVIARVPLASGYLTGKYKPGDAFAANDVRSTHDQADVAAKLRQVEEIGRTEVPAGVSMASWALAWCLRNPAVSAVVCGSKNVSQVTANAAAAELVEEK